MSRSAWNFLVDTLLALVVLIVMAVSAVIFFVFPPPSAAAGWTVWGRTLDQWSRTQCAAVILFAAMLLIHLILHWTWILGFVTARWSRATGRKVQIGESAKTLYGVATLIMALTILGAFILAATFASASPHESNLADPEQPATRATTP